MGSARASLLITRWKKHQNITGDMNSSMGWTAPRQVGLSTRNANFKNLEKKQTTNPAIIQPATRSTCVSLCLVKSYTSHCFTLCRGAILLRDWGRGILGVKDPTPPNSQGQHISWIRKHQQNEGMMTPKTVFIISWNHEIH